MSGAFPSTPKPKSAELGTEESVVVGISLNKKRQARVHGGQLWSFNLEFPTMTRDQFAPIFAFIAGQRGDSFQLILPMHSDARGTMSGLPTVSGAHITGENAILCNGTTGDTMLAGDFVKFAGHSKAYMLTEDVTFAASLGTLNINPPLIETVTNLESWIYDAIPFTVAVDGDVEKLKTTQPKVSTYNVKVIEHTS